MSKIEVSKVYIVIGAVVICILAAICIRFFFNQRKIQAYISPTEIYVGELVAFSDSTVRANTWRWEFGNGDVAFDKAGNYRYREPGVYQIRLTVDDDIQKEFFVNVKEPVKLERDTIIKIIAPDVAVQGEYVTFRAQGIANEWNWSFGQSKSTDSREQVAIYSYDMPGKYEITLLTDITEYPVTHTIEVLPGIEVVNPDDDLVMMGNDIRERLQAIVDGKPFNPNYNYVLSNYLCGNSHIIVVVNGEKYNDFYSYCQGLKIIGRNKTTIVEVEIALMETSGCVQRLMVTQFTK